MWLLPEQTTGFFNTLQKEQLTPLFNALQPGNIRLGVPNAQQAGAIEFIDLLLARDPAVYEDIDDWKILYPEALIVLDQQSQLLFNKKLQEINEQESTLIIAQLEKNELKDFPLNISQTLLFDTLRRHCIQGCFCDPRWGGNKEKILWKWVGYQEETKTWRDA